MNEGPKINFNTILLMGLGALVTLTGFLGQHTLIGIEKGQDELKANIMPRQEIEVRLKSIEVDLVRIRADITVLQQARHIQ